MTTVAVTGASGFVGSALVPFLRARDMTVRRLVRRAPAPDEADAFRWDPDTDTIDPRALDGVDAVVHLAGANLAARRWSPAFRELISRSRTGPTSFLARVLGERDPRPVLVSASGIGYYGDAGDRVCDETSPRGEGFLAEVAEAWERAAAGYPGRRVTLRIGVVLHPAGGALGRMLPLFRAGLGGPLGPGTQYLSWIGRHDLLRIIHRAVTDPHLEGPVNACAPEPVTNRAFTQALARALHRPAFLRVPAFALRLLLGPMGRELLLFSTRAVPKRLLDAGFEFDTPSLPDALPHPKRPSTATQETCA